MINALVAPRKAWRVGAAGAQQALLTAAAAAATTAPGAGAGAVNAASGVVGPLGTGVLTPIGGMSGSVDVGGVGVGPAVVPPAYHSPLLGALFIVGGYSGNLLVYENCA